MKTFQLLSVLVVASYSILAQTSANAIDKSWAKPAPVTNSFHNSQGTCVLKNRTDPLPAVHDVTWEAILMLDPEHRDVLGSERISIAEIVSPEFI